MLLQLAPSGRRAGMQARRRGAILAAHSRDISASASLLAIGPKNNQNRADKTIEEMYQRKTPVEHVLLRPGMYIGATEPSTSAAWVAEAEAVEGAAKRRRSADEPTRFSLNHREVTYPPGLLKLFDEILVNACDNKARDPKGMSRLEVRLEAGGKGKGDGKGAPCITITNDGRGIPIVLHPKEKLHVPDLIFGQLLTGSNFGDSPKGAAKGGAGGIGKGGAGPAGDSETTGGRHGYGAKLANIFSTRFSVETVDTSRGLWYRQEWSHNMQSREEPSIVELAKLESNNVAAAQGLLRDSTGAAVDFTRIVFWPDMSRFGSKGSDTVDTCLNGPLLSLMHRRVLDAAGTLAMLGGPSVRVSLDGRPVPVTDWPSYVSLYCPEQRIGSSSTDAPATAAGKKFQPNAGAKEAPLPLPFNLHGEFEPSVARRLLTAVQHTQASKRLEVTVGCAGLRMGAEAGNAASGEHIDAYNAPGCVVSFVNGMSTPRGGTHVALVQEAVARRLAEYIAKKLKRSGGSVGEVTQPAGQGKSTLGAGQGIVVSPDSVNPSFVKSHFRLWLNTRLPGPTFDSQSKEQLVSGYEQVATALVANADGVSHDVSISSPAAALSAVDGLLSDKFIKAVAEEGGVYAAVMAGLYARAGAELARSLRKVSKSSTESKVKAIPKLEDANLAGGKQSNECTLILTEGDSAKALAVAGLAVVGRDRYGVFPLKGKLLNVRDVSVRTALDNTEVAALVAILGMDLTAQYSGVALSRGLRYGRVMIMADQDVDGSHIKGLIINLLHAYWPRLLESCSDPAETFVQAFVTPVIKARSGTTTREFYSMAQFETWRAGSPEASSRSWSIKYYKGLGTSTSEEGRAYFRDLPKHVKPFVWSGQEDGDALHMAFAKDRVEDRKLWIARATDADEDLHARKSSGAVPAASAVAFIDGTISGSAPSLQEEAASTSFSSFVHSELIAFSRADLSRSVPSSLDGLKPSQRKVLHACFRRAGGSGSGNGAVAVSAALRALQMPNLSVDTDSGAISDADDDDGGEAVSASAAADPTAGLRLGGEVKVAQLAGYVAEHTAYHHGEASLNSTIVGMAQDFVGSNNVPLLQPVGQFGTRLAGGKDAASARYIFTRLAPASRLLFPTIDDDLLARREDDGTPVEPVAYLPVVPALLLNGAAGIGTGWSTNIPPFHPLDVADAVEAGLDAGWSVAPPPGERGVVAPFALLPWWKGFHGLTAPYEGTEGVWPEGFVTWGRAEWVSPQAVPKSKSKGKGRTSTLHKSSEGTIPMGPELFSLGGALDSLAVDSAWQSFTPTSTSVLLEYTEPGGPDIRSDRGRGPGDAVAVRVGELPVGRWTEEYKTFLQGLVARGTAKELREYHTESRAEFLLVLTSEGINEVRALAAAGAACTGLAESLDAATREAAGLEEVVRSKARGEGKDASSWPGWAAACACVANGTDTDALLTPALHSWLKLSASISTRNMHAFDPSGRIARYTSPWEVVREVMPARGAGYLARAVRLEAVLSSAHARAETRARFLREVTSGRLLVAGRGKAELIRDLWERGYPNSDGLTAADAGTRGGGNVGATARVAALVALHPTLQRLLQPLAGDTGAGPTPRTRAGPDAASRSASPSRRAYDHLLSLPLWQLTSESKNRAEAAVTGLATAVAAARAATPESLWRADLSAFRSYCHSQESYGAGWVSKYKRQESARATTGTIREGAEKVATGHVMEHRLTNKTGKAAALAEAAPVVHPKPRAKPKVKPAKA